jgi:hypothetical protein
VRRGLAAFVALAPLLARAEDSRDPSEAAPLAVLRVLSVEGGAVRPDGVTLRLDPDRRTLRAAARFLVEAPPGEHALTVEGPPIGTRASVDGAPVPLAPVDEPEARACSPVAAPPRGIDPTRAGRIYPLAQSSPAPCARLAGTITVGASGRALLELAAPLSPGFDRQHRRRTFPEVAHRGTRRVDFFVYHYALAGPAGPIALELGPHTDGSARWDGPILRAAVTERLPWPLAVTALVGLVVVPEGVKVAGRLTLDLDLPWGDAIVVGADGDHSLRASASLGYQLFARWIAFWPVGAHFETSAVVDFLPRLRVGARLGAGGHFNWFQSQVLLDLFRADAGGVDWRVTLVSGIGF